MHHRSVVAIFSTLYTKPSHIDNLFDGSQVIGRYIISQHTVRAIERKNELITLFLVLFAICCRSNAFIVQVIICTHIHALLVHTAILIGSAKVRTCMCAHAHILHFHQSACILHYQRLQSN